VTADGRCYLVHLHPQNTTQVRGTAGAWVRITQEYVAWDAPLRLGAYQTSARQLLAMLSQGPPPPGPAPDRKAGPMEWDPERGTFVSR
jgi:hypothetical protein